MANFDGPVSFDDSVTKADSHPNPKHVPTPGGTYARRVVPIEQQTDATSLHRRIIRIGGRRAPVRRPSRVKVLLYSHDTYGLGHLRRNLAIADRLLRSDGRFSVRLLTGSPVIHQWKLPHGLAVQPLPPVVKTGAERYVPRESSDPFGLVKGYREALILQTVLRDKPDVFLVDHAPAGMNGELLSALALIRYQMPQTRTVLGLRDILDSPETVRALWHEQEIYTLLERAYDDIFVYGSRRLFDVVEGYGIPVRIGERVRYCGHVVARIGERRSSAGRPCWNLARADGRPVVLLTAGGGGDGFFLMDAYFRALACVPAGLFRSVIVTGPLMPEEQRAALQAASKSRADVELVGYTTDLMPSIRAADLVVAMAGYNTTAEIIAGRKRAILVPRAGPRAEQLMRARLLAKLGVVRMAEPGAELATNLATMVPAALASPVLSDAAWAALDLHGADRVAAYLQERVSTAPACVGIAA
jgi:predicted glycosyltransferase